MHACIYVHVCMYVCVDGWMDGWMAAEIKVKSLYKAQQTEDVVADQHARLVGLGKNGVQPGLCDCTTKSLTTPPPRHKNPKLRRGSRTENNGCIFVQRRK